MRLIYTTGAGQKRMEFAVVRQGGAVPEGARVLAVCDGLRTVRRLDEQTFRAMTDEDYYEMQALIADAQAAESAQARDTGPLRRIFLRAFGR
jgi:hypothetical protein